MTPRSTAIILAFSLAVSLIIQIYDSNNTSSEYSFRVLGVDFEIGLLSLCFYCLVPFTWDAYIASNLWVERPRRSQFAFERFISLCDFL